MIRELPRYQVNADAMVYGVTVPGLLAYRMKFVRARVAWALVKLAWRVLRDSKPK